MIQQLSRRMFRARYPQAPWVDGYHDKYFFPPAVASWYLEVAPAKDENALMANMAAAFTALMMAMHAPDIYFFTDRKGPFLRSPNDNPYDQASLEYFSNNGVAAGFEGALRVPLALLRQFVPHVLLLTSSNGVTPDVLFIDSAAAFYGHLCKEGNLHLTALKDDARERLEASFRTAGLFISPACNPHTFA